MKKIVPISLIGIITLMLLLPFGNAFASYGLNGLVKNGVSTLPNVVDGNLETVETRRGAGVLGTITFDEAIPVVKSFFWKANQDRVNVIKFYDSTNKLIYTNSSGSLWEHTTNEYKEIGTTGEYIPVNLTDVKKVVFENTYTVGTTSIYVYEFDLYEVGVPSNIPHDEIKDLSLISDYNLVTLHWQTPIGNKDFTGSKIYRNGELITSVDKDTNVFIDSNLKPSTNYSYKITALYSDGFETNGSTSSVVTKDEPLDPSKIPPSNVTSLIAEAITGNSAKLSWVNSNDDDLDKVKIYNDDLTLLTIIDINDHYVLTGLNPNTTYRYHVSLVDLDGNESIKQTVTFTTNDENDLIPPSTPKGLNVEGGSNALYISWDRSPESDVTGYNVYLNGVKHNFSLVKSLFYTIGNLENEVSYDVQVSSVDRSGNESPLSLSISGMPLSSGMPILGTDYDLKDVALGIEKWFSSYWLLLAFAIAIPLSFYIASKVKLMLID